MRLKVVLQLNNSPEVNSGENCLRSVITFPSHVFYNHHYFFLMEYKTIVWHFMAKDSLSSFKISNIVQLYYWYFEELEWTLNKLESEKRLNHSEKAGFEEWKRKVSHKIWHIFSALFSKGDIYSWFIFPIYFHFLTWKAYSLWLIYSTPICQ